MIIGIALVVDELHKGQRLVYRYPESVPSSVLNSTEGLLKFHRDYQSLSPDNFAKLFRPKASLFNKILELTIDDLHYISFPCPCSDELSTDVSNQTATDAISLFNVVIATVRESAIVKLESIPRSTSEDQRRSLFSKKNTAGSDPVAATLGLRGSATKLCPNAVRRTVETISRALLNQEKRSRYVSRQVALMLRLQEEAAQRGSQMHQISKAQQQSNYASNENYSTAKKNILANAGHSSNEMNSSTRKKNKSGDSLQQSLAALVVTTSESVSRCSAPSSIAATPTSRSTSALEASAAAPTVNVTASPSGTFPLPGIWIVSPQRTASPPVTSIDTAVTAMTIVADKDMAGAGVGLGLGTVPLSTADNDKNIRGAGRKPVFDKKLEVMESMQMFSTLANELRMIYHGLIGGHSVNLTINNTIPINIRLSEMSELRERIARDDELNHHGGSGKGKGGSAHGSLDPPSDVIESGYQTMLCIADKDEIMDLLTSMQGAGLDAGVSVVDGRRGVAMREREREREKDESSKKWVASGGGGGAAFTSKTTITSKVVTSSTSSGSSSSVATRHLQYVHPALEELLTALDPTVSLEMLSAQLEQPLSEVFKLCRHLQEWGLGSLTSTITSERKYRLIPMSPNNSTLKVCRAFNSVFQEPLNEAMKHLQGEIDKMAEECASSDRLAIAQALIKTAKEKLNCSDDCSSGSGKSSVITFPRNTSSSRLLSAAPTGTLNPSKQSHHGSAPLVRGATNAVNVQVKSSSSSAVAAPQTHSRVARECGDELQHSGSNTENRRTTWTSLSYGQMDSPDTNAESCSINSSYPKNREIAQYPVNVNARKSVHYTLQCVLSVFDGSHTLDQSIRKLPAPLQPFGVDIVVWLLRRRLINEIDMYFITLEELDFALARSDTRHSPSGDLRLSAHDYDELREDLQTVHSDRKMNLNSDCHSESNMIYFTEREREAYMRLVPYFNGLHTLKEIAWRERMLEEDILKIARNSPHVVAFNL